MQKSNAPNKEPNEDSGVSSRKSELSAHIHCELSAIERLSEHHNNSSSVGHSKDEFSSMDLSKRFGVMVAIDVVALSRSY